MLPIPPIVEYNFIQIIWFFQILHLPITWKTGFVDDKNCPSQRKYAGSVYEQHSYFC